MKHKALKRTAGFLLSLILICGSFAGCSGKDQAGTGTAEGTAEKNNKETAMGRFLEEEIDTGIAFGNIYDMKKLEDGTLRIIGSNGDDGKDGVWDSKDQGVSWEKTYDFPAELGDGEKGYIDRAALSPDGKAVCVFNEFKGNGVIQPVLYLLDAKGTGSRIPFELPGASENSAGNMIMWLSFAGSGQVLAENASDTIYQINIEDGSVKQTYEFDASSDIHLSYAAGEKLLVFNSSEALVYDTGTGEQIPSEETFQKGAAEAGLFQAVDTMDAGESVFCLSSGGVYHYKFGGSVMEQLVDGKMNSLGAPAFYPIALAMLDEQNFLVAANDTNSDSPTGIALLKYTYSPDTPAMPEKELKVYSLYDNREMRQSITRFQKEHTDIYVNYQAALTEENGVNISDALKTLTTEIMAGKGPDLLILDGMPVEAYMEKGILKDISSVVGKEGNYFEKILNAYQDEQGQLFAAPARFMIPMVQAGGAWYQPGEDFDTFTGRKDALVNMDPKTVIEKFWYTCGAAWQKDDGTLDQAKITEFLTKLKNAYGEYDEAALEHMVTAMAFSEEKAGKAQVNLLKNSSLSVGQFDLAFGRLNTNAGLLDKLDYGMMSAVNKKLKDGDYGLMPGQADHVFVPAMILGISSKSSETETAEQFLQYLFSTEAQKISQSGGLPVEQEAFKSVIDGHEYKGKDSLFSVGSSGTNADETLDYRMVPTPEKEIKKFTELAESLATPALRDDVIMEAVSEQGEKVLKGEISPEQATDAIMQKVNIYLAE